MKKTIWKYVLLVAAALLVLTAAVLFFCLTRMVAVPNVTGKTLTEATELLTEAKFKVATTSQYSDTIKKDCVISQSVGAGEKARFRSEISLVVSLGKEQLTVPNVVNLPLAEAEATLKQQGFVVATKEGFSDTVAKGNVISQVAAAGKKVNKCATITLTVSKGADLVTVPDVRGMSKQDAEKAMKAAGLRLEADLQSSNTIQEDYVISQAVAAGEQVSRNSAITVVISVGVANTAGTTPANARYYGRATAQGDWIYFSGDGAAYRMKKDKSQTQRICDHSAVSLNVIGEWLYYSNGATGGIYKIKIDGTQLTKLSDTTSYRVYVEGDWIYYTSKYACGMIYKMKTDGSEVTKLTEDSCYEYIVNGQYIYYINESNHIVYRCGIDGSDRTIFYAGFKGTHLALVGERLLVVDKYEFKSVKLNGEGYLSFGTTNVQPMLINGYDGWLYYLECDFRDSGNSVSYFCRIRPDGTEKTKIYDYEYLNHANAYLNVVDDWLYFQKEHDGNRIYRVSLDGTKVERMA